MQKTAALRAAVFSLFTKNHRGGGRLDAPGPARVKCPMEQVAAPDKKNNGAPESSANTAPLDTMGRWSYTGPQRMSKKGLWRPLETMGLKFGFH